MINDERSFYLRYSETLKYPSDFEPAITSFFHEDATINIVHPFNQINGPRGYLEHFLLPLQDSLQGLYRRDDIVMLGEFEGNKWISSTGYYVGQFTKDWVGI